MSSRTQRWRERLPAFLQTKEPEPVLIDGELELERAFQIMQLLKDLPETSQARVLNHVWSISHENSKRRADFYGTGSAFEAANDAAQPTPKPAEN